MIWTPEAVPDAVSGGPPAPHAGAGVEVVLDVARNAANKIAVALGADAAHVSEGVELFRTDLDGDLSMVEQRRR